MSSTESIIASATARDASRPYRFVITAGLTGKSATHQPPLRPDAPKPAISRSTTSTFSEGSRRSRQ